MSTSQSNVCPGKPRYYVTIPIRSITILRPSNDGRKSVKGIIPSIGWEWVKGTAMCSKESIPGISSRHDSNLDPMAIASKIGESALYIQQERPWALLNLLPPSNEVGARSYSGSGAVSRPTPEGVSSIGTWRRPRPQTAAAADGTHPTGMHYLFSQNLSYFGTPFVLIKNRKNTAKQVFPKRYIYRLTAVCLSFCLETSPKR